MMRGAERMVFRLVFHETGADVFGVESLRLVGKVWEETSGAI